MWVLLVALTVVRMLVAAIVPLSPDETYYWVWSRALAPGYFDHPPMVALWIRAGTGVFGATSLGVRLLAPLSALAGSVLLAAAARDLLGLAGRGADRAVLLLNATLMLAAGSVVMTPDTPLLFFWTATLACLGRALAGGNTRLFLPLGGLCCGLAFSSKYTGALLVPAIAATVLLHRPTRAWLRRPETWVGVALALLATLPVIAWNAAHHFASFTKQGGRVGDFHPARALRFEGELLAGQLGLVTPFVLALAIGGLVICARRVRHSPGATLVLLAAVLPGAVFVLHATGDRVQANWPSVLVPSLALAAALPAWRWLRPVPAAVFGFALAVPLYLQAATGVLPLPAHLDVTLARLGGWSAFGASVARADAAGLPVAADDYSLASELAWTCAAPRVLGAEARWSLFRLPHPELGRARVLVLRSDHRHDPPAALTWPALVPGAGVERARAGRVAERYATWQSGVGLPRADVAELPIPARCGASR